jgi:malto-oligosyltrehalose trehalohydrolase
VRSGPGRQRHIHLVLENDNNIARYLERANGETPRYYDAQWNDDIHHALHLLLTGESDGYYSDYCDRPLWYLGRCLTEGFAYQGEASAYRHGERRGEPSAHLPPFAFVSLLQNHDQVGNRAFGERLSVLSDPGALRLAVDILLLAPSPPLLFMGEEWHSMSPFLFFCDFEPGLAAAVTEGRRREFARFERFADPAVRERIPDPGSRATFEASRLDWDKLQEPDCQAWLRHYQRLLELRRREIVPRLPSMKGATSQFELIGSDGLQASWQLNGGSLLRLLLNAGNESLSLAESMRRGRTIYATPDDVGNGGGNDTLPPWSLLWSMDPR